jgi:translation initiation factor 3 subunit B
VTYSPHADDHPSDMKRLIIWDVRTGMEKRNFSSEGPAVWPIFRWSQDDRFFARIGSDVLSVYETPVRVLRFHVFIGTDVFLCVHPIH